MVPRTVAVTGGVNAAYEELIEANCVVPEKPQGGRGQGTSPGLGSRPDL